jgi:hypothetical protein
LNADELQSGGPTESHSDTGIQVAFTPSGQVCSASNIQATQILSGVGDLPRYDVPPEEIRAESNPTADFISDFQLLVVIGETPAVYFPVVRSSLTSEQLRAPMTAATTWMIGQRVVDECDRWGADLEGVLTKTAETLLDKENSIHHRRTESPESPVGYILAVANGVARFRTYDELEYEPSAFWGEMRKDLWESAVS